MRILAIDPGNKESGFALIEMPDFNLLSFGKVSNEELLELLTEYEFTGWNKRYGKFHKVAVEMVGCYGMAVGKDVFETCVWIGRFVQAIDDEDITYIYRKDEKMNLCGSMKAKDTNIRQALINRFAKFDYKNGKGKKDNPDVFYGVANDVWQAIAVGVTYYDMREELNRRG